MQFHERLKMLRVQQGLSLREVAQRAGIPVSTYREWESGRKIIGEPYEMISKALDVSLYTLLTGKTPKSSDALEIIEKMERHLLALRKTLESINIS